MACAIGFIRLGTPDGKRHYGNVPLLVRASGRDVLDIPVDGTVEETQRALTGLGALVTFAEYMPNDVTVLTIAQQRGIPCLMVMDGVLEWRNWFRRPFGPEDLSPWPPPHPFLMPSLCDYLACMGVWQDRLLQVYGNGGKTFVTGSVHLDGMADAMRSMPRPATSDAPVVLVATSRTPAFDKEQQRLCIEYFLGLKKYFDAQTRIKVIWRVEKTLAAAMEVPTREMDLKDDLASADALLSMPSTVLIEGMLAGLPCGLLNPFSDPLLLMAAWTFHSARDFPMIAELLEKPQGKMMLQAYYRDVQCLADGQAAQRIAALIEAIADKRPYVYETAGDLPLPVATDFSMQDCVPHFKSDSRLHENRDAARTHNLLTRIADLEEQLAMFQASASKKG